LQEESQSNSAKTSSSQKEPTAAQKLEEIEQKITNINK
jgi:hypothetical protein